MSIKPRLLPAVGAALVTLTVASTAGAAEPGKKVQRPDQVLTGASDAAAAPAAAAPAARSLAAAKSSAPSADELNAQLAASTSESSAGLRKTVTVGGGTRVDLEGRFMSVMVATPTADGGYEVGCYTGEGAAEHAKHAQAISAGKLPKPEKTAPPAPAPLEEK
ncbi:MAG TPA: hypothetical protein VJP84_04015 [Steroidobacteraceae bacterium]|jgi:hypothetical protein|nr:hypothetical protein [Steroidobacteraceae bacterium]